VPPHVSNSLHGFLTKANIRKRERNLKVVDEKEANVEDVGSLALHLDSSFTLHLN
jgi:hypothetical protein